MQDIAFELSMNTKKLEKDAQRLNKELNAIFNVTGDKQLSSKIMTVTNRMEKQQASLLKLTEKLNDANKQVYTDEYIKLEKDAKKYLSQINAIDAKIARWREQGGVGHGRGLLTGEQMEAHIAKTVAKEEELNRKLIETNSLMEHLVETKKAFTFAGSTDEIAELNSKMKFLNHDIEKTIKKLYETDGAYASMVSETTELENGMSGVESRADLIANSFGNVSSSMDDSETAIGNCSQQLAEFVSNSMRLNRIQNITNHITNAFTELLSTIKSVERKMLKLVGNVLRRVGNSLKTIAKRMISITGESNKQEINGKKLVNTMLKYGLGIRSVFILWRKLRAYATDALKLMAQQFEEIDKTVSNIINSFNQFKNSVGTLVEPLMSTFEPVLVNILDLLNRANVALANFFAILTGRTYIYKAKKSNESYAESLNKVGSAAEEAKEDIAAYDKLLVINRDDANGNGSGNGDDDELVDAFEKTLAYSPFAEQLKEAIEEDDWEGVGSLFAGKLNLITSNLNHWIVNDFAPASKTWAKRLGETLNGAISDYNWKELGVTLGNGTNAIFDAINTFYKKFDALNLGKSIAESIGGWFETTDFKLIGQTVANRFNMWYDLWNGVVTYLPWGTIGDQIAKGINGFTSTINTKELGQNIAKTINGGFELLNNFSNEVDWGQLGTFISNGIDGFFDTVEGAKLGEAISNIILGLIQSIETILDETDWEQVGNDVGDFLKAIKWKEILGGVALVFFKAIKAALKMVKGLIESDPEILKGIAIILALRVGFTIVLAMTKAVLTSLISSAVTTLLGGGVSMSLPLNISLPQIAITAGIAYFATKAIQRELPGQDTVETSNEREEQKQIEKQQQLNDEQKKYNEYLSEKLQKYGNWLTALSKGTSLEQQILDINKEMQAIRNSSDSDELKAKKLAIYEQDLLTIYEYMIHDLEELDKQGKLNSQNYIIRYDTVTQHVVADLSNVNKHITGVINNLGSTYTSSNNASKSLQYMTNVAKETAYAMAGIKDPNTTVTVNTNQANKNINTTKTNLNGIQNKETTVTANTTSANKNLNATKTNLDNIKDKTVAIDVQPQKSNIITKTWKEACDLVKKAINNNLIDPLNKLTITMNDIGSGLASMVGSVSGGQKLGANAHAYSSSAQKIFNIPALPLAQGAVIPANREFLAILGDQKQGTNVEAPLSTIEQAVENVLARRGMGQDIVLNLDGRTVAKVVWDETEKRYKQTGVRFA